MVRSRLWSGHARYSSASHGVVRCSGTNDHEPNGGTVVIPHSYLIALSMTVLTMICWGSWANVVKLVGEWRFELLYYDYALGILLTSIVAGLTLGSMGSYGRPFWADLAAGRGLQHCIRFPGRSCLLRIEHPGRGRDGGGRSGCGFPHRRRTGLVIGVIWNYLVNPQGNRCCYLAVLR